MPEKGVWGTSSSWLSTFCCTVGDGYDCWEEEEEELREESWSEDTLMAWD